MTGTRKAWFVVEAHPLRDMYSIIYDSLPAEPPMSGKLPERILAFELDAHGQTLRLRELMYRYQNGYSLNSKITWKDTDIVTQEPVLEYWDTFYQG